MRPFLATFAARVLSSAFGILGGILIARALGPQGKGSFAAVQMLVAFAVTVATGAGVALTHYITKRAVRPAELLLPMAMLFAVLSCATTLCGIAYLLFAGPSGIAFAAMLAAPASILLTWQLGYFSALGLLRSLNLQVAAAGLGGLAAIWLALRLQTGPSGVVIAWALSTVLVGFAFTITATRAAGGVHRFATRGYARELVSFGWQSSGNSLLGWLTYRIDAMLIGAMLGLTAFGVYSVAVNLAEALLLISRTVPTVLTKDIGGRDAQTSARISARAIRCVTALIGIVAFVAWFAVPALVHALYGSRFDGAVLPFRILLPGIVTFATVGTFCAFFIFQLGRPGIVTWLNVVTIAIQGALCALLIPRYGLAGAAFASSATYVAGAVYCTIRFCRCSKLAARDVWILDRDDLRWVAQRFKRTERHAGDVSKPLVLVTGAAGRVATLLRPILRTHYRLRLCDKVAIGPLHENETFVRFDLLDAGALKRACRDVDAIVHLGSNRLQDRFETHVRGTAPVTYSVLEAARLAGIERVVLASTGHVSGFASRRRRIDPHKRTRPDSLYAAAKAFCEALGSLYADKFGMRVFVIRIGHCSASPIGELDRAIWVSPRDLAQLVRIGLEHPAVQNDVVYGVSRNRASVWDGKTAAAFGYRPEDSADVAPVRRRRAPRAIVKTLRGEQAPKSVVAG